MARWSQCCGRTRITNVLTLLVRRGRIDADHANVVWAALDALEIARVPPDAPQWRESTMAHAAQFALSAYDASYLTLAVAANARLATLDGALRAAATSRGIAFTGA